MVVCQRAARFQHIRAASSTHAHNRNVRSNRLSHGLIIDEKMKWEKFLFQIRRRRSFFCRADLLSTRTMPSLAHLTQFLHFHVLVRHSRSAGLHVFPFLFWIYTYKKFSFFLHFTPLVSFNDVNGIQGTKYNTNNRLPIVPFRGVRRFFPSCFSLRLLTYKKFFSCCPMPGCTDAGIF